MSPTTSNQLNLQYGYFTYTKGPSNYLSLYLFGFMTFEISGGTKKYSKASSVTYLVNFEILGDSMDL